MKIDLCRENVHESPWKHTCFLQHKLALVHMQLQLDIIIRIRIMKSTKVQTLGGNIGTFGLETPICMHMY